MSVDGSSQVYMQIAAVLLCNSEEIDFAPPAHLLAGSMHKKVSFCKDWQVIFATTSCIYEVCKKVYFEKPILQSVGIEESLGLWRAAASLLVLFMFTQKQRQMAHGTANDIADFFVFACTYTKIFQTSSSRESK